MLPLTTNSLITHSATCYLSLPCEVNSRSREASTLNELTFSVCLLSSYLYSYIFLPPASILANRSPARMNKMSPSVYSTAAGWTWNESKDERLEFSRVVLAVSHLPVSKGWTTPFWLQRMFPQLLPGVNSCRQLPFLFLTLLATAAPVEEVQPPARISPVVSHSISLISQSPTFTRIQSLTHSVTEREGICKDLSGLTLELGHRFRLVGHFRKTLRLTTDSVHGSRWNKYISSKSTTCYWFTTDDDDDDWISVVVGWL